jgi:hypothetical protein
MATLKQRVLRVRKVRMVLTKGHGVIRKLGFDSRWVQLVLTCISIVSYLVIINGQSHGHIIPTISKNAFEKRHSLEDCKSGERFRICERKV